jgi:glycosyltransferase involved in cell wall biosynthesis
MLQPWALANEKWKKRAYLSVVERPVLRGAVGLRALTSVEKADYRQVGLNNPVSVIPNGVDIPIGSCPRAFLETFPHLANRRLLLFLGRLHPKKGIDLLCRAWARLEKSLPDVHLVIAGPDEAGTLAGLIELVSELNLSSRITFTGLLRSHVKWSALAAATLFILPSHSEGFSVSVLEALGIGLPVLVSRNCNFPEIAEVECGWQIDPEIDQLANAIVFSLASEPDTLAGMRDRGRRLVQDNYTWAAIGNRAADTLEEWCGIKDYKPVSASRITCRR